MTFEIFMTVLKTFGLPVALLLVLGWAYWRKDRENKELNAELRENMVEMTAALVGYKEVSIGVKEVLSAVDKRLDKVEGHIVECKTAMQNCNARRT